MNLAVAILQVAAALAAVAAVALALVTFREAQTERNEDREWRREERRERWLDQLQEIAVLVNDILETVPNVQTVVRQRLMQRLKVKLQGMHWTPLTKTHELVGLLGHPGGPIGAKTEEIGRQARSEIELTFSRIFGQ